MKLSIVTTLYQSALWIPEFYKRMTQAAKIITDDYEIIFVNDGSPDNSLEIVKSIQAKDYNVTVIDLSRNFGHHKAMMTGLSYAKGEYIFLIDCDLEEQPEWLNSFTQELEKNACDVVYGVQEKRKGGWLERWSGELFWKILNIFSGLSFSKNICTVRLMTRRYVNALLTHHEYEIFIAGLWFITGFNQKPRIVSKLSRNISSYKLHHKFSLFINSITSFSALPLLFIFYTGLTIFTMAFLCILILIGRWLFFSTLLAGWTSVMVSIWLLGGLIISFIGIIGIYLAKIFSETKRRPLTIIKDIYEHS